MTKKTLLDQLQSVSNPSSPLVKEGTKEKTEMKKKREVDKPIFEKETLAIDRVLSNSPEEPLWYGESYTMGDAKEDVRALRRYHRDMGRYVTRLGGAIDRFERAVLTAAKRGGKSGTR